MAEERDDLVQSVSMAFACLSVSVVQSYVL